MYIYNKLRILHFGANQKFILVKISYLNYRYDLLIRFWTYMTINY